jgi:hypothetical protein
MSREISLSDETGMETPQKRALRKYRKQLTERGLARFEVLGLGKDRDLIRALARKLAENGDEAARLRAEIERSAGDAPRPKGGIWAALRRSPLVGADLDLSREDIGGRAIDL